MKKICVAGFEMPALTIDETARYMCERTVSRRAEHGPPDEHTSLNGQVVALAYRDPDLRAALQRADLISCDSQPIVFFSRLGRVGLPERVATTDLIHAVAEKSQQRGLTFYLLGATEETNRLAYEELKRLYPGLCIRGRRNGYFLRQEEAAICNDINRLAPDFLWLGLGVPLEQHFITRNHHRLWSVGLVKTSGGCFKVLAGEVPRPSIFMQKLGFEWFGRICNDPRHVLWRYLWTTPYAIWLALRHRGSKRA